MAIHCVSIKVTGKVQGVSFRAYAQEMAASLGLAGFVRNEADGSVYIEAEGEEEQVEKFIEWCREGTEYAKVEDVEVKRQPLRDMEGFRIERGR